VSSEPSPRKQCPDDPKRAAFEILIGRILQAGVALSIALLSSGFVWHALRTGSASFDYRIENVNFYEFLASDARDLLRGSIRPRFLVSSGIATLLLTPYLRVLASMIYFSFVERDLEYSLFTGFVFALLTYGLLLR
jgi:uncharacterized membrane protein